MFEKKSTYAVELKSNWPALKQGCRRVAVGIWNDFNFRKSPDNGQYRVGGKGGVNSVVT